MMAFRVLDASLAPVLSNLGKMSVPDDGGGKIRKPENVGCILQNYNFFWFLFCADKTIPDLLICLSLRQQVYFRSYSLLHD